jgi:hypothetical protein
MLPHIGRCVEHWLTILDVDGGRRSAATKELWKTGSLSERTREKRCLEGREGTYP